MELYEYWQIFRRRWWLPVVLTLTVALISTLQLRPWQTPPPTYSASLRMLVGVLPAAEADVTSYDPHYYAWQTSEYLVDDFTEVVRSDLFARQVSQRLASQGITIPAGLIQGSSATGKLHRILSLTLTWPDQAGLETITAAAVAELQENISFYFRQLGTENAFVTILDDPQIAPIGPALRQRLELPLRILLAAITGILLVFLLDYFDRSIRSRQEIEQMGLRVMGEIPRHRTRR
jgi:capsular polysaccharide biosynthesis protein